MMVPGEDRRSAVRIPRILARTAVFSVLCLCACAAQPPSASLEPVPAASSAESGLFSEIYQSVIEYHVEATRADTLSLAALDDLSSLDPELAVSRDGDNMVLRDGSRIWRVRAPAAFDTADWGKLTATLVAAAREASPKVSGIAPDKLEQALVDHMLATLDRFSHYARPAVAREWRAARDGYGRIVTLNGVPSSALTPDELRKRLRGPARSTLILGIQRAGIEKPLVLKLYRTHLVPESVSLRELNDVAVIKVTSFNQQTGDGVMDAIARAHREMGPRLKGFVLDLRGNPGGLLDQAIAVASQFLDGGTIATTIGRNPESFQYFAAPANHHAETLPLVVLVNGGSASASEIVAAALQDAGRAVVVGTASYGKGTVQTVLRTRNDGELTVTWARLITPKGYFLHHHGVVPTVCTSQLPDKVDVGVLLADSPPAALMRPRDTLSDAGWIALRDACPATREGDGLDLRVAHRLLDNAVIYARVLGTVPVRLAHTFDAVSTH